MNIPSVRSAAGWATQTVSEQRKATPIFSGVMRYFPDAIAAVARLSKQGNDKHNPGEPLHWSRDKSNDHADCIARHQIDFDKIDAETGEYHAVAVAWRALAQLQLLEEMRTPAESKPIHHEKPDCTCGARRMKSHNLGCPVRDYRPHYSDGDLSPDARYND